MLFRSELAGNGESRSFFNQRASVLAFGKDTFYHAAQSDAVEKFRGVMRLRIFCFSVIHLMPEIELEIFAT